MEWFDRIFRFAVRSAILWGGLTTLGFYAGLTQCESWIDPTLLRYVSGRWEAYAVVSMFFVGVAAIVVKGVDLVQESISVHRPLLEPPTLGDSNNAIAKSLLKQLDALPKLRQQTAIVRRMRDALDFTVRKGGQDALDEHLRYLAEIDALRMSGSYALPRFLAWAIAAVGSLGTVLGIAAAVANLSATATPEDPFAGVSAGLAMAFDTMALALTLSIVLVCLKFVCEQRESQILLAVELLVEREISERMGSVAVPRNSQFDQLRKLTESVVEATEKLAQRQTDIWQGSVEQTTQQWSHQSAAIGEQLEAIVSRAVSKAVTGQPIGIAAGAGMQAGNFDNVQQALQQIAEFFSRQNAEQIQESEVFRQLAEMIRDGSAVINPRATPHMRKPKGEAESLVGLWNSFGE